MRDHGRLAARFWIGETGKQIRELGSEAVEIAVYLVSSPHASMTGVYYLPLHTIGHETGKPSEKHETQMKRVKRVIHSLEKLGYLLYDYDREYVCLPSMARFQIAEELNPKDKRVGAVRKAFEITAREHPKFGTYVWRQYAKPFHLGNPPTEGDAKPLPSPCAPEKQDQEQIQEQEPLPSAKPSAGEEPRLSKNPAIAAFQDAYAARYGSLPAINSFEAFGKGLAKAQAAKKDDVDGVRRAAGAFMACTEEFVAGKAHPWSEFVRQYDRWHEVARKEQLREQRRREVAQAAEAEQQTLKGVEFDPDRVKKMRQLVLAQSREAGA